MELKIQTVVNEDMTAEELVDKLWSTIRRAVIFMDTDNWGDVIILDKLLNRITEEKKKISL